MLIVLLLLIQPPDKLNLYKRASTVVAWFWRCEFEITDLVSLTAIKI